MNSSDKPAWKSKKFLAFLISLGALIYLAHTGAAPAAFTTLGLIASLYLGGQGATDAIRARSADSPQ